MRRIVFVRVVFCVLAVHVAGSAAAQLPTRSAGALGLAQSGNEPDWVDRFGNPLPDAPAASSYGINSIAALSCSGFMLDFDDVLANNGVGFDDGTSIPAHPSGAATLGALRQATACEVFKYLDGLIVMHASATPDLRFLASATSGTNPAGQASQFYHAASGNPQGGTLHTHVTTGNDVSPGYDAAITMDFGNHLVNGAPLTFNSDYTLVVPGKIDLFTVILHEAVHALGFASLMGPSGASIITGVSSGPYALFDRFLRNGAGNPLLSAGANPSFTGSPTDLVSNKVTYFEATNAVASLPVKSPGQFKVGSSLSHLDTSRQVADLNGTPYFGVSYTYVMGAGEPNHKLTDPELDVLCNLGYDLGSICTTDYPVGIGDVFTGSVGGGGGPYCIDVINNDVDLDGNALAIDPGCGATILNGNGPGAVAQIVGNQICYTPPPGFVGTAAVTYCPTDGTHTGNETIVVFDIPGTECPDDPCNLVCNGGFEAGTSNTNLDFNSFASCPSKVDNWCKSRPTPDLFVRGAVNPMFGIPSNFFSNQAPGGVVDTWNGIGNDRYVGMWYPNQPSQNSEGLSAKLVKPLTIGKSYRAEFRAYAANQCSTCSPHPGDLEVFLDTDGDATPSGGAHILGMPSIANDNQWHLVQFNFQATAALDHIVIQTAAATPNQFTYVFLDDVRIEEDAPLLSLNKSVDKPAPKIGETVTFTIEVCNQDSVAVMGITVEDVLPPGLTHTGGSFQYPTHTIPSLALGGCAALTITAQVTSAAPVGVTLTNCARFISDAVSCDPLASRCADITVPTDGMITGTKFKDENANGVWDGGEPGLPSWQINLVDDYGNIYTDFTDNQGNFMFGGLAPGSYTATESMVFPGWTATYPPGGKHTIELPPGMAIGDINFGNAPLPEITASIGIALGTVPGGGIGPTYPFHIGKFEISNTEYVAFLNDAQADGGATERGSHMVFLSTGKVVLPAAPPNTNSHNLFRPKGDGGITFESRIEYDGSAPLGIRYSVENGYERHPVTTVSWLGAVKYANWLTIEHGFDLAERAYTEGPDIADWRPVTISAANWQVRDLNNAERQQLVNNIAGFRLPMDNLGTARGWLDTEENAYNEWYKAAAYDPAAPSTTRTVSPRPGMPQYDYSVSPFHWVYGFGRDTITGADANFDSSGDPFEVPTLQDNTPVGFYDGTTYNSWGGSYVGNGNAFSSSPSSNPYGLYDMSGNVSEWLQDYVVSGGYCSGNPAQSCFVDADCGGGQTCVIDAPENYGRVLRSGNFGNSASVHNELVNSYRVGVGPSDLGGSIGFRMLTTSHSRLYCIEGYSTGLPYAWSLDGAGLNHVEYVTPGVVAGADANALALAFANSINAASLPGVSAVMSPEYPECFTLFATGNVDLKVGPAGLVPPCLVTPTGCSYNPNIREGHRPAVKHAWASSGSLQTPRTYFGLVTLPSGDLIAIGGSTPGEAYDSSTETYDPASGSWTSAATMPTPHRYLYQSLVLRTGEVLAAGEMPGTSPNAAHLYDEDSNTWSATANAPSLRRHAATLTELPDGRVLFAGGYSGGGSGPTYSTAEIYDPLTRTWSATGSLAAKRLGHSAALLDAGPHAGKVIVCGGMVREAPVVYQSCELFDPRSGTWVSAPEMGSARTFHAMARLRDGRLLVSGSLNASGENAASAEIYDPAANTWNAAAPMSVPRARHTSTLLPSGHVLVVGGLQSGVANIPTGSAEVYDPSIDVWLHAGSLAVPRSNHGVEMLSGGRALVTGGLGATATAIVSATEILSIPERGDVNGDFQRDAGDVSAVILEIFDGDGSKPSDAYAGSFAGTVLGSDANLDARIDAGDVACIVLMIFSGPDGCLPLPRPDSPATISLNSRRFVPQIGITPAALDALEALGTPRVHAYLQIHAALTDLQQQELDGLGVEVLEYVPNRAYIAALNVASATHLAALPYVRSIAPIEPEDKIDQRILDGEATPASRNPNGSLRLTMVYHADADPEAAIGEVAVLGGAIVANLADQRVLVVDLPPAQLRPLLTADLVQWVQDQGEVVALNDGIRAATGATIAQGPPGPPFQLDGIGVVIGEWDVGQVQAHPDLAGRVTLGDSGCSDYVNHFHATHVAGIAVGDGSASGGQYTGMAPAAELLSYELCGPGGDVTLAMFSEYGPAIGTHGIDLSTNSWANLWYDGMGTKHFYGNYYHESRRADEIVKGQYGKRIPIVWAAGNQQGHCNNGMYDCIVVNATAKNAITVGATNSDDDSITSFSSRGPTDDGRLKPELVAPGCEDEPNRDDANPLRTIWSTKPGGSYGGACGTSMSAPAVAGAVALLLEQWRRFLTTDPLPSTSKAILVHTAQDLDSPGPDFKTGYGRIDVRHMAQLVADDAGTHDLIKEGISAQGDVDLFPFTVPPGAKGLKVTLAWDDVRAGYNANPALVNNLDLVVKDPSGASHGPYHLDPSQPALAASMPGIADDRNVVEQVHLATPQPGTWTAEVSGTWVPLWGTVFFGDPDYSLVITVDEDQSCVLDPGLVSARNTYARNAKLAQTFTPVESGYLERIIHGLDLVRSGHVGSYNLYVTNHESVTSPGTLTQVLYSAQGVTDSASGAGVDGVHVIPAGKEPWLVAGNTYALTLEPGDGGLMYWRGNSGASTYLNGAAYESTGSGWQLTTTGPRDHGFRLEGRCP